MEQEEVVIINIKTDESITTVKDLKKYISELRDDLVKTQKGTDEYGKTVDELVKSQKVLTDVMRAGQNEVKAAAGSYNALQNEMTALRKVWKETTDEAKRNEIGQRIAEINTQLKDMDASIGNYQRNVGNYKSALEALNGSYANQRQELSALKKAMDNLDPSTKEYQQAFNRASELTHNLADQQERLKYASADLGDQISNIRGIATNMVAGFSAVNAAMGLFGEESEDVQKAMLKVQQAMAVVQGMQGLDGFLKRTQGLSTAMKVWLADTKAVTTATKAQTTATNAQTVATETATVAQKGLNAAMKSNPIGLIIIAVTALVALFAKFKTQILNLVGGVDKVNAAFARMKAVIAGLFNVIAKQLLVPIRETINVIKTLAKVISDAFSGNWDKVGEDIKEGMTNSIDILKDGYNVIENYNEAHNASIEKSDAKAAQNRAQARTKELDDIIATNDAKYDSDWKYTESGKVLYEEYLQSKIDSYKEDSKEYKDAVNDKLRYDREYTQKLEKEREEREKKEKEEREKAAKAAEDAKKKAEQIEKNYQSQIQKNYGTSIRETINAYKEQLNALDEFYTQQLKVEPNKDIRKVIQEQIKIIRETYKNYSNQDIFKLETDAMVPDINSEPEKTKKRLEKEAAALMKTFDAVLKNAMDNSYGETVKKINDSIINIYKSNIETTLNKELLDIKTAAEKQTLNLDWDIEFGDASKVQEKEIEKVTLSYQSLTQQLALQKKEYEDIRDFVEQNNLTPSEEYDNAIQKIKELEIEIEKANVLQEKELGEIRTKYFNQALEETQKKTNEVVRAVENSFKEATQTGGWFKLLYPSTPQEEQEYINNMYNAQKDGLTKLRDLWQSRLDDEKLTNEQRIEAQENFNQIEMELDDLLLEHQIKNAEKRQETIQLWVGQMSSAIGTIGDLFGTLAGYYEDDLKAQVQRGDLSKKEAEKQFERTVKPLQIAQASISTLQGMVSAFSSAMPLGLPAGPIVGAALASMVGAMGAINIAKIKNTKLYDDASNSSNISVTPPSFNEMPVTYTQNITRESDIDNLRNAFTESLEIADIRAYVVESDITSAQKKTEKKSEETSF